MRERQNERGKVRERHGEREQVKICEYVFDHVVCQLCLAGECNFNGKTIEKINPHCILVMKPRTNII